ncbi:hypothetical protein [Allosphingosinicella sp.]|jgi:hypothetical protein|uniref:hypothetical protein n=1 Tax=Allosphingosinicella sp. TaxID=2823234 RepID=UPI002F16F175
MRRSASALLSLSLLGGCAGYAADYWRPEISIIAPQLTRYGFTAEQSQCVGPRLTAGLSVWQLRQLERIARLVPATHFGAAQLAPRNLLSVSAAVGDRRVQPIVEETLKACNVLLPPAPAATPAGEQPAGAAAPSAVRPALWLNLGAAPSGQSIAVNAASIEEEGTTRQAWFRLTNPGEDGPSSNSYLLRIDCTARSLNSLAFRRHGHDGEVIEERDYRPAGEGAGPIAGGTVMEIAFLALCT